MEQTHLFSHLKLALVAHDAGGAEILSAMLLQHAHWQASVVAQGPAQAIFQRKLKASEFSPLEEALQQADWVLCGTGWQSDLEWQAMRRAKELGKPVVAFLDHWVNYRERFERNGQCCLPDQIWVGDQEALTLAKRLFPEVIIALHPNPYFSEIRQSMAQLPARDGDGQHLLYVCEPIAAHAAQQFGNPRHWGYTEFDALAFFLQQASDNFPGLQQITIRPHPSEPPDKYVKLLQEWPRLPLRLSTESDLKQDIVDADAVFGCNSMALVIAMLAEKPVYCCIPEGGPACNLPHKQITMLRDMPS